MPSVVDPSAPVRPPIVQDYSRRQEMNDTCPTPVPSSSDPPLADPLENVVLSITLCKGTHLQVYIFHC